MADKFDKPAWMKNAEQTALTTEVVPLAELPRKRLRPINNWVIIRKLARKDKISDAGVVLKEAALRQQLGEVLAVADVLYAPNGKALERAPFKRGDWVVYTAFPIELKDVEDLTQDREQHLVRFEEVYAVVEDIEESCT
jgi:co-chaperonin GroES (HSP10)